jgi:hypothetical protein
MSVNLQAAPVWEETRQFGFKPWREGLSAWHRLTQCAEQADIYHRPEWAELLARAYGFELSLATIGDGEDLTAGCILARSRTPFKRRWVSLPFSDLCPPLHLDAGARDALLTRLWQHPVGAYELRGINPGPPWQVVDCFIHWAIDLRQPRAALERATDRNFRRNLRRAAESQLRITCGSSALEMDAFHALQVQTRRRLGLLAQPRRFFHLVRELFASRGELQVWLAHHHERPVAALVVLHDRQRVHVKWAARALSAPVGANHLLFWSVLEHYAGGAGVLDLGRSDRRNEGLNRFKRELGAHPEPLPYAFFPDVPRLVSVETTSGPLKAVSAVLQRLPIRAADALGSALYRFLN